MVLSGGKGFETTVLRELDIQTFANATSQLQRNLRFLLEPTLGRIPLSCERECCPRVSVGPLADRRLVATLATNQQERGRNLCLALFGAKTRFLFLFLVRALESEEEEKETDK